MVDQAALTAHIKDYAEVFETTTDRVVCPITLRECEEPQLVNGHILNGALLSASRRQVIQYGKVDGFYGTRVEPELVQYLNLKERSIADLVRTSRNLVVEFGDGTTAKAFVTGGRARKAARRKFPTGWVRIGHESIQVFARVGFDDPRLTGDMTLAGSVPALPGHWVAAMLKASFLAMFDMIGYRLIRDPLGDTLRRTLASYFRDQASREAAADYFRDFQNSVKLLGKGRTPSDLRTNYQAFEFDTLEDRMVLLHFSGASQRLMFAATCIFKVNEATVTITIPQSLGGSDVAAVWRLYLALLAGKRADQSVYRAQFKDSRWEVETKALSVHYLDGHELSDETLGNAPSRPMDDP